MKINLSNTMNSQYYYSGYSYTQKQTIPSFGANSIQKIENSKSVLNSINTIKNILHLPTNKLSVSNLKKFLDMDIRSMAEYKDKFRYAKAALAFKTNQYGDFRDFVLYVPQNIDDKKFAKPEFLSILAHEYTHYQQFKEGNLQQKIFFNKIKNLGINDETTVLKIAQAAKNTYLNLSTYLAREIELNFLLNQIPKGRNLEREGQFLIGDLDICEKSIIKEFGYKTKKEFLEKFKENNFLTKKFDKNIDKLVCENKILSKMYVDNPNLKNTLKELIIYACKSYMQNETEAYYVQNQICKIQNYNERISEIRYKTTNLVAQALK